jgi:hypothetical protein
MFRADSLGASAPKFQAGNGRQWITFAVTGIVWRLDAIVFSFLLDEPRGTVKNVTPKQPRQLKLR